jgi:hypothetical protein
MKVEESQQREKRAIRFLLAFLLGILIGVIVGCTHELALEPSKFYKKTLRFEVDGQSAIGTISLPQKPQYRINIETPQKPQLVKISSCHQEQLFIKPGKALEFVYKPDPYLEAIDAPCPVEISVLEESGQNRWGLLDFKLPGETMTAKVHCNGQVFPAAGSYICQSRDGLIQALEFNGQVYSLNADGCSKIEGKGSLFFIKTAISTCLYIFGSQNGELFRLMTFGYNEATLE